MSPNTQNLITVQRIRMERMARFNPLADLTPQKLTSQLGEFEAGFIGNLARTIDAMEVRDDVLAAVVPKTKAAVSRHDWDILTISTKDPAEAKLATRQQEVLERFYNELKVTSALDQDELGGVRLLINQLLSAHSARYSVHHIVWSHIPKGYTARMIQVPLWFCENTEGRMRFIQEPYGTYGVDMTPGAWLVAKGGNRGIACAVAWMYKHLPLRDWLIYCSRHGMPGFEGITDAAYGSAEWNALLDALEAAASEFAWAHNRSSEIKTIDFSAQGQLPHPPLVERMDRAMTAIWRGADLSTISSGSGAGRGASLQGEEADIIESDMCAWVSETLQLKLDRMILDLVFGPNVPALAYFNLSGPQQDTTEQDLKIDDFAIAHGHPVSRQQFAERYNRPVPDQDDEDDALLTAPAGTPTPSVPEAPPVPDPNQDTTAANETNISAVNRTFVDRLGIPPGWLAPVQDLIEELVARAEDTTITDDELLGFIQQAARRAPEVFKDMDIQALADVFEAAMGSAAVEGVRDALRAKSVSLTTSNAFNPKQPRDHSGKWTRVGNNPSMNSDADILKGITPKAPTEFDANAFRAGASLGKRYDYDADRFFAAVRAGEEDVPDWFGMGSTVTAERFFEQGLSGYDMPEYVVAIRIGDVPDSQHSFNFRDQKFEKGVSVLRVLGTKDSTDHTYESFNPGKRILVGGFRLDGVHGSDGEPLIVGADKIRDL